MTYNETLAGRVRDLLNGIKGIDEKKMSGGLAFLLNGKMFCGILKDELIVRVGKENDEKALARPGARPMDFTGRPIKGFLYISKIGYSKDEDLAGWIDESIAYVRALPDKKPKKTKM